MKRVEPGPEGVVVYQQVPVVDVQGQKAYAYLLVVGVPRHLPSHDLLVFLNDHRVNVQTARTHPSFAGDFTVYNSPTPSGAKLDPYEALIDVSAAMQQLGTVREVDVSLVAVDLSGTPLRAADLKFQDLSITRRA
jgi:hypothetical protein